MVGKTLNHYRIVSLLGKGGMGEVYVAEDARLGRQVALKVMPPEVASHADRRSRFEREAKAIAALNHPNIVTIHSVEEAGGVHFLTMELVRGKAFSDLIPKRGLSLDRILNHGIALADAVASAHRQGVTHRDLKPENLMVNEEGRLKVLDFGLAKLREDAGAAPGATHAPTAAVTQEGKILGTVAYMSPEQAEGKTVDSRSDLFSIGVILYEMATGQRPFRGDTPISMITSIIRDSPVSVTELNHSLPRHLGRIVKRCLAKDPDRRYQTATDLRNDLQELKEEIETGELAVPTDPGQARSQVTRWSLVGIAAAVVLAAGAVGWWISRGGPAAPWGGGPGQGMELTRLTTTGKSFEAAISPDGKYVVYVVDEAGRRSLWVTQVSTASAVRIVEPSDASIWDPIFSPDGDFVYYIRQERDSGIPRLYQVPVLGGSPRKVLENAAGRPSFAPDGKRFAFLRSEPETGKSLLLVVNRDGTGERVIATRSAPDSYNDPVWSPDGTTIIAAAFSFSGGIQARLVAVPAEGGGEERQVASRTWASMSEIAWLPDGEGLVINAADRIFLSDQIWEVTYPEGRARRVTNDLNFYHGVGLTADGKTLVTHLNEPDYHLWVTGPGGEGTPVPITSGPGNMSGFGTSWTPEGRLVYAEGRGGVMDLWSVDPERGSPTRLTSGESLSLEPVVSPDGRHIVFTSDRAGTVNLWRADNDGGNPVQLTRGTVDVGPDLTPDGKWIYFIGFPDQHLFRVPIDGGEPVKVLDRRLQALDISRDGTRLALYIWHPDAGKFLVDIFPIEGGDPMQSLDLLTGFYGWSPDGRSIHYVFETGGVDNIWSQPLDGGPAVQITRFDADSINDFAWSRDGSRLAVSRGRFNTDIVLLTDFR